VLPGDCHAVTSHVIGGAQAARDERVVGACCCVAGVVRAQIDVGYQAERCYADPVCAGLVTLHAELSAPTAVEPAYQGGHAFAAAAGEPFTAGGPASST
jgi:hypothetical protein